MRIALFGPSELTSHDKTEIRNYVEAVIEEHHVSLLAYRSIEREVFKFFVEHEEYASKLTIYTFPELHQLPADMQTTIRYLVGKGAVHKSFYHNELLIRRTPYVEAWEYIMDENDAVVTFFDEKNAKLMIPIDVANRMKKRPFIFSLPVHDASLMERKATDKIRLVQ